MQHAMTAEPTEAEKTAVDSVCGPIPKADGRTSRLGFHQSQQLRNLLLPALWAVQDALGNVSEGAIAYLSDRLLVPPAEAYGVASFYSLLNVGNDGGSRTYVCDDIVCRRLVGRAEAAGEVASPCLGQCDRAPARMVTVPGEQPLVLRSSAPEMLEPFGREITNLVGRVDPGSLASYEDAGGFSALVRARAQGAEWVISQIEDSGLTGRGGAAFPTGLKWKLVAAEDGPRHLVCNADESEPGTFKDRYLMEGDPFSVVESVALASFAVGSNHAYIYIRGEYPLATARLQHAIEAASSLLGDLTIEIRRGAGAYICGEETALFNSVEGYRGEPRQKPPYPTVSGLFGRPTAVNNVETLAHALRIVRDGADLYRANPTRLFSVSGDVSLPGVVEAPIGTLMSEVMGAAGGVIGELVAILVGGAAGTFALPEHLDLPLSNDAASERGLSLGSGVLMAFNTTADFEDTIERIAEFFADESCGQCVPCRVGAKRQAELVDRGRTSPPDLALLNDLAQVMADASICGLGHTATNAIRSVYELGLVGESNG